ncbi:hypothetical protein C8R44DRAFT_890456 [Mycena epipterygia]|nr:hypothetical protein C8R44DRAFT_890456 [Mycena epipterygia]
MKILAICNPGLDIVGLLTLCVKYGFPFGLYIKTSEVRQFSNRNITSLTRNTLASLYAPGYVDEQLKYSLGFSSQYNAYKALVGPLLARPEAVAFIAAGGILSYIAQLYDDNLAFRFLRGPSLQVTEYGKDESLLHTDEYGTEMFLTADCVSPSEISQLIGHVPTGNPGTETFLWPHPAVMEEESLHSHGGWTPGCYAILENLKAEIFSGHAKWRTRRGWITYFHAGNMCKYAPTPGTTPTPKDFHDAQMVINKAYPINWDRKKIRDIKVPESFDPIDPRD